MEDPRKQPPSYVDYMNDVFEATLPNEPEIDRKFKPDGSSNRSKHDYYKDKWMEVTRALNDNVIVRVNRVDFGIDWKIFAKLEPSLDSCHLTSKQQLEDGTKVFSIYRNVSSFVAILDFYRNGQLHMPGDVCPNVFKRELEFWRVDFREMSQCCLRKYANFHDDEQTLSNFDQAFNTKPDAKFINAKKNCPSKWARIQACGWAILSDPSSSIWAKIYLGIASFFVVLSIFLLAASTNRTFLRELEASEWEEFMSDAELDYYYELIYKRPKPQSGSGGGSSSSSGDMDHPAEFTSTTQRITTESSGHVGPRVGKRSIPDEVYEVMLNRERQSKEKQDMPSAHGETGNFGGRRDTLVNPLDLNSISENNDVLEDEKPQSEAKDRKRVTKAPIDLQDLLESILTRVLEEASRRTLIKLQNLPSDGYVQDMKNGRRGKWDSSHLDWKDANGKESNGESDHRIHRRSEGKRNAADDSNILHIYRSKRSASSNDTQSPNSNETDGNIGLEGCVYMNGETLSQTLKRVAAEAVSIISPVPELPTAYNVYSWARYLEMVCIVFFAVEFFIRFLFAPSKIPHLLSSFTIIDFLALVTMLTTLLIDTLNPKEKYTTSVVDAINCFQVARVFRFFRLMRNVVGFRVLVFSIRSSWRELLLLVLYIVMAVTIFSTMIYYSEKDNMKSIPDASWWAIVTMTTVGYGDMAPTSCIGKLIGVGCALSGVLLIAVTVPVFVNNFLLFYEHSKVIHYERKRNSVDNSKTPLPSDSNSEISETTFVEESVEKESGHKQSMSRESSQSEWSYGKPRLKSQISMSKVVPIMIKNTDGAPQDEKQ